MANWHYEDVVVKGKKFRVKVYDEPKNVMTPDEEDAAMQALQARYEREQQAEFEARSQHERDIVNGNVPKIKVVVSKSKPKVIVDKNLNKRVTTKVTVKTEKKEIPAGSVADFVGIAEVYKKDNTFFSSAAKASSAMPHSPLLTASMAFRDDMNSINSNIDKAEATGEVFSKLGYRVGGTIVFGQNLSPSWVRYYGNPNFDPKASFSFDKYVNPNKTYSLSLGNTAGAISKVLKYGEMGVSAVNIYQLKEAGDDEGATKESVRLGVKTAVSAGLSRAMTTPNPYAFGVGVVGTAIGVDDTIADGVANTLGERMVEIEAETTKINANQKIFLERAASKGMAPDKYWDYLEEKYPEIYKKPNILSAGDMLFQGPTPQEEYFLPPQELK